MSHETEAEAGLTLCLSLVDSVETGESVVLVGAMVVECRASVAERSEL